MYITMTNTNMICQFIQKNREPLLQLIIHIPVYIPGRNKEGRKKGGEQWEGEKEGEQWENKWNLLNLLNNKKKWNVCAFAIIVIITSNKDRMSKLTMEQQTMNFIESASYNIPFGFNTNNEFSALLNIQKDKNNEFSWTDSNTRIHLLNTISSDWIKQIKYINRNGKVQLVYGCNEVREHADAEWNDTIHANNNKHTEEKKLDCKQNQWVCDVKYINNKCVNIHYYYFFLILSFYSLKMNGVW